MVRKQHPFGLSFTVFVAMAGIMIHMIHKHLKLQNENHTLWTS